jgi:hypothetical protein
MQYILNIHYHNFWFYYYYLYLFPNNICGWIVTNGKISMSVN